MSRTREDIEHRIETFAAIIRLGSHQIKPDSSWFLVNQTNYSRKHYQGAVALIDLLDIHDADMCSYFTNKWVGLIGQCLFDSHLQSRKLGKSYFISVRSNNNSNIAPTRENIIFEDCRKSRNSCGPVAFIRQ